MKKNLLFLSLFMLLLLGRAMAQSVELTFNEGLTTSYKLKFTVIEGTDECSVKASRPATQLTPLEIPTKVTINNSDYYVTEIDSIAFRNNSKFSSVTLPDSLKIIRGRAFYHCTGLTGDLIIPDNVTYIGEYAFYGCYNMKGTLKLSEDLVTIGQYAFSRSSSNNTNMGFSGSLVIPNKVKTIGHYAFNYCTNLKGSLDLPESLTSIGDYAFYYCSGFTGDLIIPKNVKTIGSYAFYYCTGFNSELVFPNGLTSIGNYAFTTNSSSTGMNFTGDLVIPNSVTYIGSYAFYNAGFSGDLILSENLTAINNYTFYRCKFKGNLRIPNSVTSIGSSAFYNCSYFDGDLSLPASLQTINSSAFYGCSKFNIMYCYATTPPTASSNSFTGHNISILYVPEESVDTYWETSPWADEFFIMGLFKIEDYEVEVKDDNNNVLYSLIYDTTDDFSGVSVRIGQKPTSAVELVIPETLWYVEENFTYNVTTIPAEAFKDCSFFTGVEIPKYVNNIGENAFSGCSNINIIKSLNPIPPSAAENSFRNATARVAASSFDGIPTTAKLFVFPNYMDYYDIEPWNRFEIKPLLIDHEEFYYEGNSYYTLIYNLNEDYNSLRVKIGRISGSPKTLSIPNSIYDIDVTTIENRAFYYTGNNNVRTFENLVLPNTITHIGDSAFATYHTSYPLNLKGELIIPNSVTSIGERAFYYCRNFTSLSFEENSNLQTIGDYAFAGYYYDQYNIIGMGFTGELNIPNSVISVGNYAFHLCNKFTSLTFEENSNLKTIGDYAFAGKYGYYDNYNMSFNNELKIPNSVTSIGNYAFYYCNKFTSLSFEENSNLMTIGNYAFASYSSSYPMGFTEELNIPNSVTSIGNYAFYYCNKFTSLSFEENSNLQTIGGYAFYYCDGFTGELNIPNSVTSIGNYAFYRCYNFTSLSFEENSNLQTIGNYAFAGTYSSTYMGFTGELNIPNSVTSIGQRAFAYCTNFTSLTFEENSNLQTIGDYAFAGYDGNYSSTYMGFTGDLIIPNSVTSIGNYAFYYCNKFTGGLIIPNSVTSIGACAFNYCRNFTSLSFEENSNLLTIGNYAFYDCNKFTGELIIPNSVTSIGQYAFYYCEFDRVICYSTVPAAFTGSSPIFYYNNSSNPKIYVPAVSVSLYKSTWNKDTSRIYSNGLPTFLGGDIDDVNNWYVLGNGSQVSRLPNENEEIAINAALTINDGEMLNVKSLGYCENGDLTMKEGGQLKCNKHYSDIKVEKNIEAHGTETTTWTTISSPLATVMNPSEITNLTSGNYDLYRYDEPSSVWQNYKNSASNGFTSLETARGYIYSNKVDTKLTFEGKNDGATSVSYELTKDSEKLPGFHLIGNPYTHNISLDNLDATIDVEVETQQLYERLTIELRDSYGDGWDGDIAALQIISDDGTINQSYTLTEGSYATYELEISYKPIKIIWKSGNNDHEDSFVIKNENGETILSYGTNTLNNIADGTVLYESESTITEKQDILAEGYYSLSNEGAWGAKYGEETEIKPCQGILVKTTDAGYLTINSEAPQTRSAKRSVNNFLAISVSNNKYEDKAYISFNKGTGLDKIAHENENIPMVYIPVNNADYAVAIQDKNFKEIPIYFEAGGMGEYTISISQSECGFDRLYLYDKAEGKTVNILKRDYTFFATSSDFPDRFVLKTVNDEVLEDFTYINNGNLVIENIVGNANIEIFDVLGRNVMQNNCSDDEYEVSTDRFSAGVYIIRKTDDNGIKTQKVVID
ncbi:MAG: leucine-rich repeat domain-containing protein [Bacteroidales bacterium]|nr:leucine-rich repeat domain-containing protein [Bacteroidales bacterium]